MEGVRYEKEMLEKLCQRAGILQARPEQEDTLHPGVHAGGMPDFEYGMLPGREEVDRK